MKYLANILLILLLLGGECLGADFYIRTSSGEYGAEDGTTYATAFDGWAGLVANIGSVSTGDTVYICGELTGEYINWDTADAAPNGVTFDGGHSLYPGSINNNSQHTSVFRVDGPEDTVIKNLTITGSTGRGISYIVESSSNIIDNCYVHSNGAIGIFFMSDGGIIKNSRIDSNGSNGVSLAGVGAEIQNCTLTGNGAGAAKGDNIDGIFLGNGCTDCLVSDTVVSGQIGQTAFDVSSGVGGGADGKFLRCSAINGSNCTYGYKISEISVGNEVYLEYCNAVGFDINFCLSGENGTVVSKNCSSQGATNNTEIIIAGATTRNITIQNFAAYSTTTYTINIPIATDLTFSSSYNCLYGGTSAFARIAGSSTSWAQWNSAGYDSTGSLNQNPSFQYTTMNSLQSTSPCINAGTNTVWSGTANITDYLGKPITNASGDIVAWGGTVDIGAYEYSKKHGGFLGFY